MSYASLLRGLVPIVLMSAWTAQEGFFTGKVSAAEVVEFARSEQESSQGSQAAGQA